MESGEHPEMRDLKVISKSCNVGHRVTSLTPVEVGLSLRSDRVTSLIH